MCIENGCNYVYCMDGMLNPVTTVTIARVFTLQYGQFQVFRAQIFSDGTALIYFNSSWPIKLRLL